MIIWKPVFLSPRSPNSLSASGGLHSDCDEWEKKGEEENKTQTQTPSPVFDSFFSLTLTFRGSRRVYLPINL
jgi:hypothetical protein